MLSGLTKKTCILVIVILSSTLAAGIVQDSYIGYFTGICLTT